MRNRLFFLDEVHYMANGKRQNNQPKRAGRLERYGLFSVKPFNDDFRKEMIKRRKAKRKATKKKGVKKSPETTSQSDLGYTDIMLAVIDDKYEKVQSLLATDNAKVNAAVKSGRFKGFTAIMFAAESGYENIVELLIKNGAKVDGTEADGRTAIMLAAESGYNKIIELLLENGADVNGTRANGKTALMYAAQFGKKETVELLIKNGAKVDAAVKSGRFKGFTAIKLAAYSGYKNIVEVPSDDIESNRPAAQGEAPRPRKRNGPLLGA